MSDTRPLEFLRRSREMATYGYTRYAVWWGIHFVGEVFQFVPNDDGRRESATRWLAQERRGVIHGWTVPIRTRKEAGEILAAQAGVK